MGPDDPDPKGGRLTTESKHAQTADLPAEAAESSEQPEAWQQAGSRLSQAEATRILDEVTGINQRIAEIVMAELGIGLDQFQSEAQLVSWAGLCPAAKISAGKRLSSKTGKGNRWLKQALIEAAHGAARSKHTYLGACYQRLKKRLGSKKAIVALAHRILVILYHLLKEHQS